jgi:hypothetical protein
MRLLYPHHADGEGPLVAKKGNCGNRLLSSKRRASTGRMEPLHKDGHAAV